MGLGIGCIDDGWCVVESFDAMEKMLEILDGATKFTLYVDRTAIGQDMNLNDRRV